MKPKDLSEFLEQKVFISGAHGSSLHVQWANFRSKPAFPFKEQKLGVRMLKLQTKSKKEK